MTASVPDPVKRTCSERGNLRRQPFGKGNLVLAIVRAGHAQIERAGDGGGDGSVPVTEQRRPIRHAHVDIARTVHILHQWTVGARHIKWAAATPGSRAPLP